MLSHTIDGDKLKVARLRKGWTVRDVSARCSELGTPVDFGNYSRYERGEVVPAPAALAVTCAALDIEVADVLVLSGGSAA